MAHLEIRGIQGLLHGPTLLAAFGFGLSRGLSDWASIGLSSLLISVGTPLGRYFLTGAKVLGVLVTLIVCYTVCRKRKNLVLAALPSVALGSGCLLAVYCGLAGEDGAGLAITASLIVGFGASSTALQWLELCGSVAPKTAVAVISAGYLVNFLFSTAVLGNFRQGDYLVASLALLLPLILNYCRSKMMGTRESDPPRVLTRQLAEGVPLGVVALVAVFAFAYGFGESATDFRSTSMFAKVGGALPAFAFAAAFSLAPRRADLGTLMSVSLVFMVGGLMVVPLAGSMSGFAQVLISASIASCYIVGYTSACAAAYRSGISPMASCGTVRVVVIALSLLGGFLGSRAAGEEGLFQPVLAVTVMLVLLTYVLFAARNRDAGLLAEPSDPGDPPDEGGATAAVQIDWRTDARDHGLTPHETEILGLVLSGKSAKDVAGELFITASAARAHLSRIYSKYGVHSMQELLDSLGGKP